MPRPKPPHLHRQISRHGKVVWYVRIGHGPRIRIKAEFGTSEFDECYRAAVAGEPRPTARKPASGTLAWLVARYRETTAWSALSPATRRQRENIFAGILAAAGGEPFADITRKDIVDGRERRRHTPFQARHFLDAMRGMFRWALEAEHVTVDPTAGVANPARPRSGGFPVWTEDDVDQYQRRWPIGTKERVWLDVLLYTGLRRGDAVVLGRQHVRNGVATISTQKTGTTVTIPILSVLAETIAAGPCGDLTFICGDRRQPMTKEGFGNAFRDACRAAGVNKSAHGVRKIGATRAAHNGATVSELDAIFGWEGGRMAALYTEAADRARLSRKAARKLERTPEEQPIPSPEDKVRDSRPKRMKKQSVKN